MEEIACGSSSMSSSHLLPAGCLRMERLSWTWCSSSIHKLEVKISTNFEMTGQKFGPKDSQSESEKDESMYCMTSVIF